MGKQKKRKGLSRQSTIKVGGDRLDTSTFAARKKLRDEEEVRREQIRSGELLIRYDFSKHTNS